MSLPTLIDTHAHVMDRAFDADREAVLERAALAGVVAMLAVGYDLPSSRAAVELARQHDFIRASVGIHPNSAGEAADADFDEIAVLARASGVVAIGETGLDTYRKFTSAKRQREALSWHRRLADELGLPLIVHNRQADAGIAEMLGERTSNRPIPGVLHCYSSTDPSFLQHMLKSGYFVSFAGPLTYKNAAELRDVAPRVPVDRLLVETDCPYLAPMGHRGQRNEPAFVRDTAMCLASLLGLALEALAERLWANSLRVFPAFAGARQVQGQVIG